MWVVIMMQSYPVIGSLPTRKDVVAITIDEVVPVGHVFTEDQIAVTMPETVAYPAAKNVRFAKRSEVITSYIKLTEFELVVVLLVDLTGDLDLTVVL